MTEHHTAKSDSDDTRRQKDILLSADAENVRYVRLQFTDLMGGLKNVEIPVHQLKGAVEEGIYFDGSSIDGFLRIEESDMLLRPDPSTWLVFPWTTAQGRVARLICDVYLPDGTPFAGDPRGTLKRSIAHMRQLGFDELNVGLEVEFFLLHLDPLGQPTLQSNDDGGYFDISPLDAGENCRRDISIALKSIGMAVEASHHEVAPLQHEIDLQYVNALSAADNLMTMRMVVNKMAREHGLHATFMPKPFPEFDGSGLHVHQSLFQAGQNAFSYRDGPFQLSETANQYIAGLLHHAKAVTAITNPVVNSYKRIIPGYDAPVFSAWSVNSPNAYVRVPESKGLSTRAEVRAPDGMCNPYLAFAVMLEAGLQGIVQRMKLSEPVHENAYTMTELERFQRGITSLPRTLEEALVALDEDEVVQAVLGAHAYQWFRRAKWQEWQDYQSAVHAWEHEHYL